MGVDASERDATRIAVLASQFAEIYRRVEEIRSDVRIEQAETRQEMRAGFASMDSSISGLEKRVRGIEDEQTTQRERLKMWNRVIPVVSAALGGLAAWSKDLFGLLSR